MRDGCEGGVVKTKPTYQIITNNRRKSLNAKGAFVKEITFLYKGTVVVLKHNHVVTVDSLLVISPYEARSKTGESLGLTLRRMGAYVLLRTNIGLDIKWNGKHRLEVLLTSKAQNKVCGICGDYNGDKTDDWRVGPVCPPDTGDLVTNSAIGRASGL
jgi:hypothetical protein